VAIEALLIAQGRVLAGQIADAALVLLLLNAGALVRGESETVRHVRAAMHALALVPLIRVIGTGLPLRDLSKPVEELLIAVPVGVAALSLAPVVAVPRGIFFSARHARVQVAAIAAGVGLGLLAYALGAPALWPEDASADLIGLSLTAGIVAAAVEEIVFRGVVQLSLQRVAGRIGLLAAVALFSASYLDAGSVALVMTVALAGVIFAYTVADTGTLGGVVVAHALFAVGAGGIWPALLGRHHAAWSANPSASIGLTAALILVTLIVLSRPAIQRVGGVGRHRERRAALSPRWDRRTRFGRRTSVVVLACILIVATGIGGYFAGRPGGSDGRQITAGRLSLRVPENWELRSSERALPRVKLVGALAVGPRDEPMAAAVVWRVRHADADFVPHGFTVRSRKSIELVSLNHYDAYRRQGLGLASDPLPALQVLADRYRATTYSIPTPTGAVIAVCQAPAPIARRFLAACEEVVSTLRLRGLGAAERASLARSFRRLNVVVAELARRREAGRRRLAVARSSAAQARAARHLQAAYGAARRSLTRFRPTPATRSRGAALMAALKRADSGYGALARAAARRAPRPYNSARGRIARAERTLRRLIRRPIGPR
jgi:membrane protease YdiL (CAAX protease family)